MKPKVAKTVIRAIGTLAALPGIYSLVAMAMFRPKATDEIGQFVVAFYVVSVAIDIWLLWIGYLVWFRFSPLAVRQTCGFLGALAIVLSLTALSGRMHSIGAGWYSLAFLGSLVFVLVGYRLLSRYLNGIIFPVSRAPLPFMPPLPKR